MAQDIYLHIAFQAGTPRLLLTSPSVHANALLFTVAPRHGLGTVAVMDPFPGDSSDSDSASDPTEALLACLMSRVAWDVCVRPSTSFVLGFKLEGRRRKGWTHGNQPF